jgi:hypothetical protein
MMTISLLGKIIAEGKNRKNYLYLKFKTTTPTGTSARAISTSIL